MNKKTEGRGRMTYVPLASARPEIQDAPLLSQSFIGEELPHRPNREVSDEPAQKQV